MEEQETVQPDIKPSVEKTKNNNTLLIVLLIILFFIASGIAIFAVHQNNQLKKQIVKLKASPTPKVKFTSPSNLSPTTASNYQKHFNYKNFSFNYPKEWQLLDINTSETFPLENRLSSVYPEAKIIALNKKQTYLIIIISEESDIEAGGIFIDNKDYNDYEQFISKRDKVVINGTAFYLEISHQPISTLSHAHTGPVVWTSLVEYVPRKKIESGEVFKGYENITKRNGFEYEFIVTSKQGGKTDPEIQEEIINTLKTITW